MKGRLAPMTPEEVFSLRLRLESERRMRRYWHKAFCISMFLNGLLGAPLLAAWITALIRVTAD